MIAIVKIAGTGTFFIGVFIWLIVKELRK